MVPTNVDLEIPVQMEIPGQNQRSQCAGTELSAVKEQYA